MSQLQNQMFNQQGIQQLVETLKQSQSFNQALKYKNEELIQELSKVQKEKEDCKKQYENQKKTIKLLSDQNRQLQLKQQQQEKMIQNLQEQIITVGSKNQSQYHNQYNHNLHDNQQSENIQDEHNSDNHINKAKDFESNKPLFNKNTNYSSNYQNNFHFVSTPVNITQSAGTNTNQVQNIQNVKSQNISSNIPTSQKQEADQVYSFQQNVSNDNINSEYQMKQRNMFTFSKGIPSLENQSTADSAHNIDNKQPHISPYSAPKVQINLFQNDSLQSRQKSSDQLQLNESNISSSQSRFEHSPNNRYNGTNNSKNIQKVYEQNFLKISQNSNIFTSSSNSSPNKQNQLILNTEQYSTKVDNFIIQNQKDSEIKQQSSNKKRQDHEPNYTDEEDDDGDDSDDLRNSNNQEEDDLDENKSYTQNNKSLITSKQTPKEFEIKQNMILNTSNHSNSFNNQDTTRLSNSYAINEDPQQNYPTVHQTKQMTFGITESPQLNYFRQELKAQNFKNSDPKSQLYGELSQDQQIVNYHQNNYQQENQIGKNQKIFDNQNQFHQRNHPYQEQTKIQDKQQNLSTSQTKGRKIFDQFPQMHYQSSVNQINNQQIQISQNNQIQQANPNIKINQDNQNKSSQISFSSYSQFYQPQIQDVNLQNNQHHLQDDDHSQHSAFFEVGSITFNDNKFEKQHSQVLISSEQNLLEQKSELKGSQIKNISARRINKSELLQNQTSNLEGYQSNLKELYPQEIKNMENYVFSTQHQQFGVNKDNGINNYIHNINQIDINEPDCNFSSGLGKNINEQQLNNQSDQNRFSNCNIQSSIESSSINESIQQVQKVQIKSPKNMMDISKKYQCNDQSYSDYLNEEYVSKNNMMENFFILSANQTQIKERVMTANEVQFVKAETIFSYPKLNEKSRQIEETIHQLSFPYGVYVKQKQKTNSQSDLLQILMHDKNNMSSDQFVFTIKTIESYEKYDNSNKNSISTQKDIVDVSNPNNLLYCICVQQRTFIDFKDLKQQSKGSKKMKKEFYYEVDSVYCIITKFPHVQFYQDVIENILSMIKVVKSQKLYNINPYDMDLFFYKNLQSEIEAKLATLLHTKIPLFKTGKFSLPKSELDQKHVNLYMKDVDYCQYLECQWGLVDTLKKFKDAYNFVKLYISLLLERSVVFVSIQRSLLSQFILLFHSILKPLKWTHAMITTLPKTLFDYLHSPTPIIIGLNDTKKNLESSRFQENFADSFNIVYLDDMSFSFMNESNYEENSDFICILNMELQVLFEKLNAKNKTRFENQNEEAKYQEEIANSILRSTKQLFQEHIVQHIPKHPIFRKDLQNRNLDYSLIHEEIISTKNIPDSFLKEFFKTQIFAYYLEEYYGII